MSKFRFVASAALVLVFISGCASSQQKLRREQREKVIQTAKLYCEFLNGEQYPDIDVALNLAMAQKCDADKTFSITNYKTPSDIQGMMYCCSVTNKAAGVKESKADHVEAKAEAKAEAKPVPAPTPVPAKKAEVAPPPIVPAKKVEAAPAAAAPAPQQQTTTTTAAPQEQATRTEVKSEAKAEAKTKTEVKTDSKQPARDPDLDE